MRGEVMKIGVRAALAVLLAAAIPFAAVAEAAPKRSAAGDIKGVALGIFLGQPTGLSCRLGLGGPSSLEAKAAWDLAGSKDKAASFSFQANYLLEFPGVLVLEGHDIPPYVGGGAQFDLGAESRIGIRIPFGLAYRLEKAPIEFCLELGIGMGLFPSTSLMTSGGLGIRYIIKGKK
jgi:hypothetical protein